MNQPRHEHAETVTKNVGDLPGALERLEAACLYLDTEAARSGQVEGRLGTSTIRRLLAGETLEQIDASNEAVYAAASSGRPAR